MQEIDSGSVSWADQRIGCIAVTIYLMLFADYGQSQAWFLSANYGQLQPWFLSANYGQLQPWFLCKLWLITGLIPVCASLELKTQEKTGLKMAYICSWCPQSQRFPDVLFIPLVPWTYSLFSCPEFTSRPCLYLVICLLGSRQPVNFCKGLNSGIY